LEDFYFEPEVLESVRKSQEETSKRILSRAKHMCDEKHVIS
jgi:predicted DNA-binding protein